MSFFSHHDCGRLCNNLCFRASLNLPDLLWVMPSTCQGDNCGDKACKGHAALTRMVSGSTVVKRVGGGLCNMGRSVGHVQVGWAGQQWTYQRGEGGLAKDVRKVLSEKLQGVSLRIWG